MNLSKCKMRLLLIGFGLFLSACGGGSSGGSSDNGQSTTKISGTVIDGEISGATVFLDLNRNGALESNEPSATTDGSGKYVLTLTAEHKAHKNYLNKKAPIVIFGGVDIRTGEAFDDYLTAIIEDENETNVTPLTTLIAETLGEELDADVNETISNIDSKLSEIKKNLSELLEIKEEMLTKNPIELAQEGNVTLIDTSLQIHKVAREMKKAMKSEVKTLRKSILKSYRAVAKSLKKLKKTAIKEGDTALVAALDDALEDNEIFESQFKEAIKEESKEIAKEIKSYWSRNRVALSDADVTTVLNGLEIVIVDANSSIVNDTEAPKIIRLGRQNITITKGNAYIDAGAIALDNKDGNVTDKIVVVNPVNINIEGKYTITYNVSDTAGNKASEVRRIVNVVAETTTVVDNGSLLSDKEAFDFLNLATFGSTKSEQELLKTKGIERWLNEQFSLPLKENIHLKKTIALSKQAYPTIFTESVETYLANNDTVFNMGSDQGKGNVRRYQTSAWFDTALLEQDQLRHRVAYALSQIIVESTSDPLFLRRAEALAVYMDILTKNAFGNYRDLLIDITHSTGMAVYLTYNGSQKQRSENGTIIYPDENYARELMQLFTIGLSELNVDGTPKLDAKGNTIPTYTQDDVNELAKVFTGWDAQRSVRFGHVTNTRSDMISPLEFTAEYHDTSAKTVLGKTIQAGNDGSADIAAAIDILMEHPNIAPFVSKQLIMRLVKSNPTPNYVARVSSVFNDNGNGVKGDLKAVVKAIYTDSEALDNSNNRKFKEPLLAYTQYLKAFNVEPFPIWRVSQNSPENISNTVYFSDTTSFLGQSPARAFSVFNFYSNEYTPNDEYFKTNNLVTPELQIQTDSMLIAFNNKITSELLKNEKGHILGKYGTLNDINSWISQNYNGFYSLGRNKYLLDCSEEYKVLETALETTVDGKFESFNGVSRSKDTTADANGVTDRDRALLALIDHLDVKLTSGQLQQGHKDALYDEFKEVFYFSSIRNADDPKVKIYENIISRVIVAIVTSEEFMVQ